MLRLNYEFLNLKHASDVLKKSPKWSNHRTSQPHIRKKLKVANFRFFETKFYKQENKFATIP